MVQQSTHKLENMGCNFAASWLVLEYELDDR
jgi:hypothetical protein